MNERIKELATQAGEEIKAEYEDESRRNRRLYNEIFLPKFAELFVKECVKVAHPKLTDVGEWAAGMRLVQQRLKQHFGVEE